MGTSGKQHDEHRWLASSTHSILSQLEPQSVLSSYLVLPCMHLRHKQTTFGSIPTTGLAHQPLHHVRTRHGPGGMWASDPSSGMVDHTLGTVEAAGTNSSSGPPSCMF